MAETYHPRFELVHGFRVREHPLYSTWTDMKRRCTNPNDDGFVNYGGRGIAYCASWAHFVNFANDMYPSFQEGLTIERTKNDADYSPENCVWADRTAQCHNRRKFKNNKTGATGVVVTRQGTFAARYNHRHHRYHLGVFSTFEEAVAARERFVELFHLDSERAMSLVFDRPKEDGFEVNSRGRRSDNTTGIPGVTRCPSGFIVRRTEKGERKYLGVAKSMEAARNMLETAK